MTALRKDLSDLLSLEPIDLVSTVAVAASPVLGWLAGLFVGAW